MEGLSHEEEKNENNEVRAELALDDSIDIVCQFLKIKDLLNVTKVCKSWAVAAFTELAKRGPERLLLPYMNCNEMANENFHPYNLLSVEPRVAFLFVGPSLRERYKDKRLDVHILNTYKKYFTNTLVVVDVDECRMDEKLIVSYPGLMEPPNGILGLFLPSFKNFEVKIAHLLNDPGTTGYINPFAADKVIENLLPKSKKIKSTLIIIGNTRQGCFIAHRLKKLIPRCFEQKNYTLWGIILNDKLKEILTSEDKIGSHQTAVVVINILGPSLESWSTVVDCRISMNEVYNKLIELRDNMKLRRHTIGLVCGPCCIENSNKSTFKNLDVTSRELMKAVKDTLPNISFISIFNSGYNRHLGVNSSSDDCHQILLNTWYMSVMIMSYD